LLEGNIGMNKFIISTLICIPITCFAGSTGSLFGTYQCFSRACQNSFLVIDKDTVSLYECKKAPYTTIESDDDHIIIEIKPSTICAQQVIKLEHEKPKSFSGFVVTTYENRQKAKENNPGSICSYGQVDPSMAEDQTVNFLTGKTGLERKDALHKINLQGHAERDKYNEIGLKDPSPDVREIAAAFLRGDPERFVPMLIDVMAHDPDLSVRRSAGFSLSHFYTDNGSEGDLYIKPLEKNLDALLSGLKNTETIRSIINILGSRYTGGSFAPCYMSPESKKKIIIALEKQLETIQLASEAWTKELIARSKERKAPWNNTWNEANHEIHRALNNINKCDLTKH
jgi:hypothetical protein